MPQYIIRDYKVNALPLVGVPNARYYVPNGTGTNLDEYVTDLNGNFRKVESNSISGIDELIKISSNDTTSGYLNGKLISGNGISLTENNDGANETLSIEIDSSYTDSQYWNLLGNQGTNSSINFIGTTDDESLVIKVNNEFAGYIKSSPATDSGSPASFLALGHYAGNTLIQNTTPGVSISGGNNTLLGYAAGKHIGATFDSALYGLSAENTFTGQWAGFWTQHLNETYGKGRNCAYGESSLFWNISGCFNNGYGIFSLESNVKGNANNAFGDGALRSNVDGDFNAAFGASTALYNSTGIQSISVTNGGSGYTSATVTISAPRITGNPGTCISTATAVAIIDAGVIVGITITDPGCGYSIRGGTFYPGLSQPPVVVTITGDGTGATATANLVSGSNNTSIGTVAAQFNRFTTYTSSFGYGANQSSRYYDTGGTFLGAFSGIDSSVSALTQISKAAAIGYNAKVGASNTIALGGTGGDATDVVIGGITARATLDIVGDLAIETVANDDTELNLLAWNSTDKIVEYRTVASLDIPVVSGTASYIPKFTSANSIGNSRMMESSIVAGGDSIMIDDLATGVTTTNGFLLMLRNSYDGDPTASAQPMLFIRSNGTSTTQKYFLGCTATSAPVGTSLSNYFGRALSSRNVYLQTFFYAGSGSTSNYVEDQFFGLPNLVRLYASGNQTIGNSITTDNGYKLQVGGTVKIDSTLYLETVANDDTEDKLLTWNSSTKDVEYRTVASLGIGAGYTDEEAQDAVGGILTNSSEIALTYSDGIPSITATIIDVDWSKISGTPTNLAGYGISDTKANFNVALSDGDFLFVGDITQYTDEMAQDAVGNAFINTNTIQAVYDDPTPDYSWNVIYQDTATINLADDASGLKADLVIGVTDNTETNFMMWDGDSIELRTFASLGITPSQNLFETIAVSGQSNIVADSTTDILTFVAGTGITITTDAGTDSITINGTGGTVTSFTFTDGNGFDGTVTNSTTTPTLSLTTTVTDNQIMISNSGAISGDVNLTWDGTTLAIIGETNLNGSIKHKRTATSVDLTLSILHYYVAVDASGANRTITLPTAASITGREYIIKKIDSSANTVVIATDTTETIDGTDGMTLYAQWDYVTIISNGSSWEIIG